MYAVTDQHQRLRLLRVAQDDPPRGTVAAAQEYQLGWAFGLLDTLFAQQRQPLAQLIAVVGLDQFEF